MRSGLSPQIPRGPPLPPSPSVNFGCVCGGEHRRGVQQDGPGAAEASGVCVSLVTASPPLKGDRDDAALTRAVPCLAARGQASS